MREMSCEFYLRDWDAKIARVLFKGLRCEDCKKINSKSGEDINLD